MSAAPDVKTTECLFCSICCTVGVELREFDIAVPSYDLDDPRRCGRGHLIGDLLTHPHRLYEGAEAALEECADQLKGAASGSEIGVIVDGNLPCEDIAAARWLARECLKTDLCAVFLPPSDQMLLMGTEAGKAEYAKADQLAECDVIVTVGDAFATHPMIARPVLDARNRQRGNRLVVIDSLPNRTAKFATDFVLVKPGTEDVLLGKAAEGGAGDANAALVADAVKGAKCPAILISSVAGKNAHYDQIGQAASALASAKGGKILPLLTYGNALGAFRTAAALQMAPLAKVLGAASSGKIKRMLIIGTDLVSALGSSIGKAALEKADFVAVAAPMPSATTELASVVIPMGFWFEEEGTVLDMDRGAEKIAPVQPPPSGALTVAQLVGGIASRIAGRPLKPPPFSTQILSEKAKLPAQASPGARPEAEGNSVLRLVPEAGSVHFLTGALTSTLGWPRAMEPATRIKLSKKRMREMSLQDGDAVCVEANGTSVEMAARMSFDLPDNVAAAAGPLLGARDLIQWSLLPEQGVIAAGPGSVQVKKVESNE